ncbi:MAG: YvrJ family protein [Firmicutes bacterium]|nr:YvrJ family protein [Bacillota bacterium]
MEELVPLIANLGFPIAVSVYLLVRIEGKMESLTLSIRELSEAIGKMI